MNQIAKICRMILLLKWWASSFGTIEESFQNIEKI